MSKFKGTKGKWVVQTFSEGQMSVRSLDNTRKICVPRVQNYEESLANLVLISKAPEMLEIFEEMYDVWRETGIGENTLSEYMFKIKQLVNDATELTINVANNEQ